MQPLIHDPAPSRLSYRITRIWLTPLYRRLIRQGIPLFLLAFMTLWWVGNEERRAVLVAQIGKLRDAVAERPEFAVTVLQIEGGNPALDRAVRERFPFDLPASSFDVDLDAFRAAILDIDAVKSAHLRLTPGGSLQVRLQAREPALVWYRPDGALPLDAEGHPIRPYEGELPAGMVPVAGLGADAAADEAQRLYAAAGALQPKIKGFIRIGQRRWDVVLTSDQRVLLPEEDAEVALGHLVALDERRELLARDISHVDMRLLDRITIRMAAEEAAPQEDDEEQAANAG